MNSFTFYKEYLELISLLPIEEQQELILSIARYMIYDEEPILKGNQKKIFINLKRPLDKSKNNSKRSKGNGAPKGNNNASKNKPNNKPENKPKTNTSNDVYVYVNGNVNKRVNKGVIGGKEEKKESYAEFVTMTNVEYEKLINTYGEEFTKKCIETLDNYKGANGKKYKSDYRAILNWVVKKVTEDSKQQPYMSYQERKRLEEEEIKRKFLKGE